MEDTAGAVVAAAIAAYVIRVGVAGNGKELMHLLSEEVGYLEFIVACYLLYLLHEQGGIAGDITNQLLWTAAIAALIKVVTSNSNVIVELENFGAQKQSLLTTLKHIFIGA